MLGEREEGKYVKEKGIREERGGASFKGYGTRTNGRRGEMHVEKNMMAGLEGFGGIEPEVRKAGGVPQKEGVFGFGQMTVW